MARSSLPHQRGDASKTDHVAASEPIARPCRPEKLKYLSHLAKHKGRSIAIVLAISRREAAPCFGRRQMLVHAGSPRALGVHGFSGETLGEERLSYLRSLQRHAAMEHGEVRSVVGLKPGVGDHTPERFADHERRRNANHQGFSAFGPGATDWKAVKRLLALT